MTAPIRLVLADDQELVRLGFRMVLDAQEDMTVVAEVSNGRDALARATTGPGCDVILMDIRMPIMDGVEATRRIVASGSNTKVLVLTTFDLDDYVYAALQAGASGFLLKDAGPAELLAGIRAVHGGEAVVAPTATRRLLERFVPLLPVSGDGASRAQERLKVLTERELEVLTAIAQGHTNTEIAKQLWLAEATVKTHVGHLLAKLNARDRIQLVVLGYDAGLVQPNPEHHYPPPSGLFFTGRRTANEVGPDRVASSCDVCHAMRWETSHGDVAQWLPLVGEGGAEPSPSVVGSLQ